MDRDDDREIERNISSVVRRQRAGLTVAVNRSGVELGDEFDASAVEQSGES